MNMREYLHSFTPVNRDIRTNIIDGIIVVIYYYLLPNRYSLLRQNPTIERVYKNYCVRMYVRREISVKRLTMKVLELVTRRMDVQ